VRPVKRSGATTCTCGFASNHSTTSSFHTIHRPGSSEARARAASSFHQPSRKPLKGPRCQPLRQIEECGVAHPVDVEQQDRRGSGHDVVLPAGIRAVLSPTSVGQRTLARPLNDD
jgi:hypothetical protein